MKIGYEPKIYGILAEFDEAEKLIAAARRCRAAGYEKMQTYTPFAVEELSEIMPGKYRNRIPAIVLIGGILGGLTGFFMQYFGALFTAYAAFRYYYPAVFAEASHGLNAIIGTVNTAILIVSSLGMAIAGYAARNGQRKKLLVSLLSAIILGTMFMVIKGFEYYDHYQHREFPGLAFNYAVPHAHEKQVFFFMYFAMTGLHTIHLTIGIILVSVIFVMAYRRKFSPSYYSPVENAGLYWHFVDVIWIFLYPLFYLIDIHH